MLFKASSLNGYKLSSLDGEIGKVKEFYFDDRHWAIRYLVADTGSWLSGNRVLLTPYVLDAVIKVEEQITVKLTKKQIENSPPLTSDKPVSQQFEEAYYGYYQLPVYWGGPYMWGFYPDIERDPGKRKELTQAEEKWDHHLRSTLEVGSYYIHAADGEIGHIEDFIIDDSTWAIRYLIINTGNWWMGKKVLVSPRWIERVSWKESKIFVNLSREAIKQSPEYSEETLPTRDYEAGLHQHYKRKGYWVD